jgi:aryl-alcohol dehydrogenase-like predicted oxidoreductase
MVYHSIKEEYIMDHTVVHEMDISKLTLGTAQLGLNYGIANTSGKPDHQQSYEILKAASDNGVNSFDTAPGYGDSELIVGSFISSYTSFSKPPIIITKLPPIDLNSQCMANNIHEAVRGHVVKSIRRMQIEKIPIYLFHQASDINACGGLVIKSLLKLKREGLIDALGASVYTPEEVERTLEVEAMEAIQVPINIFDHRLIKTGLLNQLRDRNFIVFARSIFLQGLFFIDRRNLPPGLALAEKPLRRLQELSHEHGIGIAQLAVSFVRDLSGITSLVIGAETPNQVLENVKLMSSPPLSTGLRKEIMSTFSDMPLGLINPSLWNLKS